MKLVNTLKKTVALVLTPCLALGSGMGVPASSVSAAPAVLKPEVKLIEAADYGSPAEKVEVLGDQKPRMIVLSDIGYPAFSVVNEENGRSDPDDAQSFVRLLLHSNEIDLEGLVYIAKGQLKDAEGNDIGETYTGTRETPEQIIDAYGEVRDNLLKHANGYPTVDELKGVLREGQIGRHDYKTGKQVSVPEMLDSWELSEGAKLIIEAVDKEDPRPLWVTIWGWPGIALSKALYEVQKTRTPEEVDKFVSKLRVYAISDQDTHGLWIRNTFPNLYYICDLNANPGSTPYGPAAWNGMAGNGDQTMITNQSSLSYMPQEKTDWVKDNVQSKGPLGAVYPSKLWTVEGDTPSYLGLLPNGLASYSNPSWGGWGGRYVFGLADPAMSEDLLGQTLRPHWHAARVPGGADHYVDDKGKDYGSDIQLSVARWRTAYQSDLADRLDWTVKPYEEANHNPIVKVNGIGGTDALCATVPAGSTFTLQGSAEDPDGDQVTYKWWQYEEAGTYLKDGKAVTSPKIKIEDPSKAECVFTATTEGEAHLILEVTDNSTKGYPLTSYRRVVLKVSAETTKLESLITAADKLTKAEGFAESYTANSAKAFTDELAAAKKMLEGQTLQAEIDAETVKLAEALGNLELVGPVKLALTEVTEMASELMKTEKYDASSAAAIKNAVEAAKKAAADPNADKAQIEKATKDILNALSSAKSAGSQTSPRPKIGKKYTVGNYQYKVTGSKTATLLKPINKKLKKAIIPSVIKVSGTTLKVTAVSSNAFTKNTKLASVTIGKNVKSIGKKAFYKSPKLNKVIFKGKLVKSIGSKAFSGTKTLSVKAPNKAALNKCKKLVKKAGGKLK